MKIQITYNQITDKKEPPNKQNQRIKLDLTNPNSQA
jgi:hypothetical protein